MAVTVLSPSAFAFASLARSDAPSLSWPLPVALGAPTVLVTWFPDLALPVAAEAAPGAAAAAPLVSSAAAAGGAGGGGGGGGGGGPPASPALLCRQVEPL